MALISRNQKDFMWVWGIPAALVLAIAAMLVVAYLQMRLQKEEKIQHEKEVEFLDRVCAIAGNMHDTSRNGFRVKRVIYTCPDGQVYIR